MESKNLVRAGVLAFVLVIAFVAGWEFYLRSKGFDTSYYDDGSLWANKREMVYEPANKATVFIGSSRIKFDLDINTWENITGDHAIQLACVGSTPLPILENLANDKNFKGKLVVDVTEGLFFSSAAGNARTPNENIKYYKDQTPAQRGSFHVNHLLESQFVFLDKEWLSLNELLAGLHIRNRPGVYNFPGFPSDFGRVKFNRQEYMTNKMIADTNIQNQVKGIWNSFRQMSKDPPASGAKLDSILTAVKNSVDKIRARGGQVLFVRTPSSGAYLMGEKMGFPREKYWERILAVTGCPGIHFEDYPAIAHFVCPEFSHLSPSDAIVFTKNFINILQEKGWTFPHKQTIALK
ncbi:MAG: hypothetical protein JWN83_1024 [Chitinophagaceae bacterium]|nr:hypothetical protein [Chitinophagaceae bacterium]